jgi:class 3 adenylate cyclase
MAENSEQLASYIESLESFARLPLSIRESFRRVGGPRFIREYRPLSILAARTDHYANLVDRDWPLTSRPVRAEAHVQLLNKALEKIIPVIDQGGGCILELRPENILAVWSSPASVDDPTRAVSSALAVQRVLLEFQTGRNENLESGFRIGIAAGQVYVGTIGTTTHQSYVVLGPPVTRATRLSAIAEPGQTLVDHHVYKYTKTIITYEPLATKVEIAGSDTQAHRAICPGPQT